MSEEEINNALAKAEREAEKRIIRNNGLKG